MDLPAPYVRALAALGTLVLALVLGLMARRFLLARLARLAATTDSPVDDALVNSLRRPLPLWAVLAGAWVAVGIAELPPKLTELAHEAVAGMLILAVTLWAAGTIGRLFDARAAGSHDHGRRATGVVKYALRIVILVIGGLVLLGTLGISITPVLTTLGIGGLAVALGLQETLANLFAGMQLTLAGNIAVGDFIKLETGEEGFVDDIHWRATRVRTLPNNFVIIPNNRLAQSVVTNYHRPSKDLAVLVEVGVHYASDLGHVERVVCDVAATIMKTVRGGVPDFAPFIRFHTFGASSIDFTVIMRAKEFTDRYLIKHEFIKALAAAFTREGIVIPFPIRALNFEQEVPKGLRPDPIVAQPA